MIWGISKIRCQNVFSCSCRLDGVPFFVAFLAPVLFILLGNLVTFCLVMRSLLTSGTRVTSDRKTSGYRRARQGITIMVLLGLTWLFGILVMIDDATLTFQYLFSIFNTLQGLFIFIFFCILSLETRKQLYSFVRGRTDAPKESNSLPMVARSKETLDRECIPKSKSTAFSKGDGNVNMRVADSADPNTQPMSLDNPVSETPCPSAERIPNETQSLAEVTLHLRRDDKIFSNPDA